MSDKFSEFKPEHYRDPFLSNYFVVTANNDGFYLLFANKPPILNWEEGDEPFADVTRPVVLSRNNVRALRDLLTAVLEDTGGAPDADTN